MKSSSQRTPSQASFVEQSCSTGDWILVGQLLQGLTGAGMGGQRDGEVGEDAIDSMIRPTKRPRVYI